MNVVTASNYTFNDGSLLSERQFTVTPADTGLPLPVASIFTLAIVGYLFILVTGIALRHWVSDRCCHAPDLPAEPACQCGNGQCCQKMAACCDPQCPSVSCLRGSRCSFNCLRLNSWDCCCIEIHLKNASL